MCTIDLLLGAEGLQLDIEVVVGEKGNLDSRQSCMPASLHVVFAVGSGKYRITPVLETLAKVTDSRAVIRLSSR